MNHVLVVSLSRSGGKLIRTLLDGHPQFNVLPFEHWNRSSKNEIPTRKIEAFANLSVDDRLSAAGAAHVERKLQRLHPAQLVAGVMQSWRVAAQDILTLAAMYEGLAHAYFTALGRPRDAIVVNHCGSLSRFTRAQLDAVFGSGTHLLTIRDPRAVFSSMQGLLDRKFAVKRMEKGKIAESVLLRHKQKLETDGAASGYLREFCENYKIMVAQYAASPAVIRIRFEDLVVSPEATMRTLSAQLGVRWDPVLLEPTELQVAHVPNSSFARSGSNIHPQAADDWVARLEPSVCQYLEETLVEEMKALGYQRLGQGNRPVLEEAPLLRAGVG